MNNFSSLYDHMNLQFLFTFPFLKLSHLRNSISYLVIFYYRYFRLKLNPFFVQLFYFLSLSFFGFLVLAALKPRTDDHHSFKPRNLDIFFTSVSAVTVSSMSTVEMEVFSNAQLIILTFLMFLGGEVFISMFGLFIKQMKLKKNDTDNDQSLEIWSLKYCSVKYLGFVVLGYLLVVHFLGVTTILVYVSIISSAKTVLKNKGLKTLTFSIFTTVSTFASCGFVPTNENMMVFGKNSGLLLILIPQVLLGNTLFPSCLRFSIWVFGKFNVWKEKSDYLLKNSGEISYLHLLPSLHSWLLVPTVFGFILVQFILFCSLEWSSDSLRGLNLYQKIIGVLFQCVNTRHTGETIVDLSIISPAILVLFVIMMYLPPYTSLLPIKDDEDPMQYHPESGIELWRSNTSEEGGRKVIVENYIFSQLSYLVIFIIVVCITERRGIKEDPLNFSVLNIVIEVISAYGNVGFTTGYSCKRRVNSSNDCQDKWYGFSGRWSDEGKLILIVVMFFGRLKKHNMKGGKAWKLL